MAASISTSLPTRRSQRAAKMAARNGQNAPASPDAALIAACDAYPGLRAAFNGSDAIDNPTGALSIAYYACCDTISEGRVQTMAGVLAKARAIQAEARDVRGEPCAYHGTMAETWARDVVNALLRLNGGAA